MAPDELESVVALSQPLFPDHQTPAQPPSYIALPPPPSFSALQSDDLSPLYHTAPSSPALQFYTPPTSPLHPVPLSPSSSSSSSSSSHPPLTLHITIPTSPIDSTDDPFPTSDFPADLALDEDGLSTLEKIYLFSRSKASFHRVYIIHALPAFLSQVSPHDAIEYVLPLLSGLAMDEDEQVKEALAAELVDLIWWFFTHSKILPDDAASNLSSSSALHTAISVQAFTPILGTLLLSPHAQVGGFARRAIVDLLIRLKAADDREAGTLMYIQKDGAQEHGFFTQLERGLFRDEILQQVVIGMGRLDLDIDDPQMLVDNSDHDKTEPTDDHGSGALCQSEVQQVPRAETVNPYFPLMAIQRSVPSPASSAGSSSGKTDGSTSSSSSSPPSDHSPGTVTTSGKKGASSPPLLPSSTTEQAQLSLMDSNDDIKAQPQQPEFVLDTLSPENDLQCRQTGPVPLSPTEESWVTQESVTHIYERRQANLTGYGHYVLHDTRRDYPDTYGSDEGDADEQAAVGRLSSMSLMAAVTASGTLGEGTKEAFVKEVVRVGEDSVYWVRREASFALGALAKVVPEELVICSLLPLFNRLRCDTVWHVRHSALFALPAILSRLSPRHRRSLAMETILTLCKDESPAVQCGVLEALGEVIYTFHRDDDGPPEKLLQLFLGRREDKRVRDGQQEAWLESLYNNPERPLICAFNYPAVAQTLGRERWHELRGVYLNIAATAGVKVRKTLAASLGELAKIVGPEHAQRDLVGVWWDVIRCDDEETRARAGESMEDLMRVVGPEVGDTLVAGLVAMWDSGVFRGWREREGIAGRLGGLVAPASNAGQLAVVGLVKRGLEDGVAAVREATIGVLADIWVNVSDNLGATAQLQADVQSLQSSMFRRRMTFIACQQALSSVVEPDDMFWSRLALLADDPIDGVRIGLARLVGSLSTYSQSAPLATRLSRDPSFQVRSYILNHQPSSHKPNPARATFSRPPPCSSIDPDHPIHLMVLSNSHQPCGFAVDPISPPPPARDTDASSSMVSVPA